MYKKDFLLNDNIYLLNHSVGRPLKNTEQQFKTHFLDHWQDASSEPWPQWISAIERYQIALGSLFNDDANHFCPQVNLSSALTKVLMSVDRLQQPHTKILMSESDFPSMGFVMQRAIANTANITYIPNSLDITDPTIWAKYLNTSIDLVFISHAYSNTGQQAPVKDILALAREHHVLSIVDVAQSAGIIPLDLSTTRPDFMIGSCVKWLCGGPGSSYLWVNPDQLKHCQPKDVGWFSHQQPFEFNIHHFENHQGALRFWGGTPSIMPYVISANSIEYFVRIGIEKLRQHNQILLAMLADAFPQALVSPQQEAQRNGTAILHFGSQQEAVLSALSAHSISIDNRQQGMRISPHIYNDRIEIMQLIEVINTVYINE
ncbi:aminotransferase class V-fold PLP-dependent enzyme [Moritella sp. 24]|uniref:aminotransferase class V-fold PLP-dependent enzyme n=1 Tax=Moritella sp. 24 TaxID=2746230 RepID=UPI001BA6CF01|nr:aminotransferase class V-fold PLP-dependent enzyme [Moritella sp. 24]QUM75602.1 aminotransferase class V-fold PLP-dependent enzyme [Moritella sp. 24]